MDDVLERQVKELEAALRKRAGGPAAGLFAVALHGKRLREKDSDDEEGDPAQQSFREAPLPLKRQRASGDYQEHPRGALFKQGVAEITRFLGERDGGQPYGDRLAREDARLLEQHLPRPAQPAGCRGQNR